MCLRLVETRSCRPVEQHVLQMWVRALSCTFVMTSLADNRTLEVILRCQICMRCLDVSGDSLADKLLRHAVKLALVDADASVTQNLQVRIVCLPVILPCDSWHYKSGGAFKNSSIGHVVYEGHHMWFMNTSCMVSMQW